MGLKCQDFMLVTNQQLVHMDIREAQGHQPTKIIMPMALIMEHQTWAIILLTLKFQNPRTYKIKMLKPNLVLLHKMMEMIIINDYKIL